MSEKKNKAKFSFKNIIGNSLEHANTSGELKAGLETKKCKSCGAARPVETDLSICEFCGKRFY